MNAQEQKQLRSIPKYRCPICDARAEVLYSSRWRCADPTCALHLQWVTEGEWVDLHMKMGVSPKEIIVVKKRSDLLAYTRERGEHVPDSGLFGAFAENVAQRKYGSSMGALVDRTQEALNAVYQKEDRETFKLLEGATEKWLATDELGYLTKKKMEALGLPPNYIKEAGGSGLNYEPQQVVRAKSRREEKKGWYLYQKQAKTVVNKRGLNKLRPVSIWPEDPWAARLGLIPAGEPDDERQLTFDWGE